MYWTIRKILVLIGILSTGVVLATLIWLSQSYEKFSIKNFNDTSGEIASFLVRQKMTDQYFKEIHEIANSWSRERVLVQAARGRDVQKALIGADATFLKQEVRNGIIQLVGVHVFDKELNDVTHSPNGISETVLKNEDIRQSLNERELREKRKPVAFTWRSQAGQPLHSILMPIGGFRVAGYVEYITDPISRFESLGSALSGDVKLLDGNGKVLLESPAIAQKAEDGAKADEKETAPTQPLNDANLETLHADVPSDTGQTWLTVALTRDVKGFKDNLSHIRDQALGIIALAIVICAVGGWLLLRLAVFSKLRKFADAMDGLGQGDTRVDLPATGKDEFRTMATALEMLRESVRQAYRRQRIIDNNTSCIVLSDLDARLTYANQAACDDLGVSSCEDASGRSIDLFNQGNAFVERLMDPSKLPFSEQISFDNRCVAVDAQAVLSSHGEHVSTMLTWTDITRQKQERAFAAQIMEEVTKVSHIVADQAKSLQELSQSLDVQSDKTVTQAHEAQEISGRNQESARRAAQTAEELMQNFATMSGLSASASETAQSALSAAAQGDNAVQELESSSSKIGEVTRLISDIAAQTRMLALNATIEAQRAGEAGKGFAVVANEVGRLAGMTTNATEEISEMVNAIRDQVEGAKGAIGEINGVITQINDIQGEVGESVTQQDALSGEISHSITGIADGSGHIDEIVNTVGGEAEKTGELSNDLRGTSERLSEEAGNLQQNINRYLQHIDGAEG